MKRKRIVSTFLLFLLIADSTAFMFLFWVNKVAANPAFVSVLPAQNIVDPPEVGKTFTVDIFVEFVEMVRGWELKLKFDPTILYTEESMLVEGNFLKQYGATTEPTFVVFTDYIGAINSIKAEDYVDGDGELMSITFRVRDTGKSLLDLYDTKFVDMAFEEIPDQPVPVDGEFYTRTPHASFSYLPSKDPQETEFPYPDWLKHNPIVGEQITFNASYFLLGGRPRGSYDPDGSITSYEWDFDDGQTASGQVAIHAYAQASLETPDKDYAVTLTITDNEGKTDSYIAHPLVEKHDVAVTNIEAYPTVASPGEDVSIKITTKNLGLSYEYANTTLFYRYGTLDTLIWYNQTEHKPAFCTAIETDPVSRLPPLEFPPGKTIVINYTWSTTGLAEGDYTLWANISLTDRSGKKFLKDIYLIEMDYDNTNNLYTNGIIQIFPLHNLAVTAITLSPTLKSPDVVQQGLAEVSADITVSNTGDFSESHFYVTLHQDSTLLYNWTDISLDPKTSTTLNFMWNVGSLSLGYYYLTANASIVPGEAEMDRIDDNTRTLKAAIAHLPLANFTYLPPKPLVHEQVAFDATSSAAATGWTITDYEWRINGTVASTLIGVTPSPIPFSLHAVYNITLTVTDSLGLTNSTSRLIHTYVLPTADFTCYPTSPKVSVEVTFDASLSYDADASSIITNYAWDFGDDQTGNGKIATHTYTTRGSYNVTLTITDSDDHQGSLTKKIAVIQEPVASFDYTPTSPTVDQIITFNASASVPYGGQITQYNWNLGDGSDQVSMQEPILKRKYTKAGTFQVTLMVIDSEGLNNTLKRSITITKLTPTISITASPSNVVIGQAVTIVGQMSPTVGGATIALYYREGTGPWIWLENRTVNDQGRYNYDWATTAAGSFQFKAKWAGNEKYSEAESDPSATITVLSQAAQIPLDIYLYVGGGLVAVIIIAIVAYILLKRRKA